MNQQVSNTEQHLASTKNRKLRKIFELNQKLRDKRCKREGFYFIGRYTTIKLTVNKILQNNEMNTVKIPQLVSSTKKNKNDVVNSRHCCRCHCRQLNDHYRCCCLCFLCFCCCFWHQQRRKIVQQR